MKRLLMAGNFSAKLWPMALRYATWAQMQRQLYPDKAILPFGTRVHVKRKVYGVGNRYDLESRWAMGYYLGPSADVNEGSVIMMDKGNFITTVHMRPNLVDTSREVELEEYQAVVSVPSRRLRRKATLNPGDHEGLRSLPLPQAEEEETQPVPMTQTTLRRSTPEPFSRKKRSNGTLWRRWQDFCQQEVPSLSGLEKDMKMRWSGLLELLFMEV